MKHPVRKNVNILDIIVLLVLAAVVIFIAISFFGGLNPFNKNTSAPHDNIVYTLELNEQEPDILNYIKEGQTVYDGVTKNAIGTVLSIHEKPTRELVENYEDKTIDYVELPGKTDILLEVSGYAQTGKPDTSINTVSIKVGKRINCIVGDAAAGGTIVGVEIDNTLLTKEVAQ